MNYLADCDSVHVSNEFDTYSQFKRDSFNDAKGKLEGEYCPKCKNKGVVMHLTHKWGYVYECVEKCDCLTLRKNMAALETSGLATMVKDYTFESFKTQHDWQANMKQKAVDYLTDYANNWFFVGGQVGSGKTHICTALANEFIKRSMKTKYMLWRDETVVLKSDIMDKEYQTSMKTLKTVPVLYIDDFFKTEMKKAPSTAEINIAFELLNYRYNNPGLSTIISSEKTIDELLRIDQGVGSRIFQRTKSYCVNITADVNKNYRLKEEIANEQNNPGFMRRYGSME